MPAAQLELIKRILLSLLKEKQREENIQEFRSGPGGRGML